MSTPTNKRAILLNVPHDVWETLSRAANLEKRPLTQFVIFHALREAQAAVATAYAKEGIKVNLRPLAEAVAGDQAGKAVGQ